MKRILRTVFIEGMRFAARLRARTLRGFALNCAVNGIVDGFGSFYNGDRRLFSVFVCLREGTADDVLGAGGAEGPGALRERRAGGDNIVDE